MRLKNVHIAISSLCALAGVIIAGVQTFRSTDTQPAQAQQDANQTTGISVNGEGKTAGPSQARANVTEVTPSEPPGLVVASLDRARITAATRMDTPSKYRISELFDGNPATYLKLQDGEGDIDFIVEFPFTQSVTVTGVEIDLGDPGPSLPATLEIMVLPDGSMAGSGRPVTSIALDERGGVQKFSLPPEAGKAAWIRVAGHPGQAETIIGDIKLLSASP
jgi:hypothetical protein